MRDCGIRRLSQQNSITSLSNHHTQFSPRSFARTTSERKKKKDKEQKKRRKEKEREEK